MELRHIRYFIALAEELNFSRAAERLQISQPPLSRQIRELEEEIGAQLFYRNNRQVELTNAGKVFLTRAYRILDQVEQATISTRLSSTGKDGEFRIGFNSVIQDVIPTLRLFRERYPSVGFTLQQMTSVEQIEALHENRIDIGTVTTPVISKKITTYPLHKMHYMAALPNDHHLVKKSKIYIQDFEDESFIVTHKSAGPLYYDVFMRIFQAAHFLPKITVQAHDMHTVLALVAAGFGVALTPTPMRSIHGVTMRKVEDVQVHIKPSLAWRKDNRSEILQNFLDYFFEFYKGNSKLND